MPELEAQVDQWSRELALADELADLRAALAPEPTWVALADAERAAGVSKSTLRAWYRAGRIPSRLMPGPNGLQRLVPLEDVLAAAERAPRRPRTPPAEARKETKTEDAMARPPEPASGDALVRMAELATSTATERAERAEARAAVAEAALHAALERAVAAETELRLLRRG